MTTIVALAESITTSLASNPLSKDNDANIKFDDALRSEKRSAVKMKCQIFDSLSKIAAFVCDHNNDLLGSYSTGLAPIPIEQVFLTSRLLLTLSSLSSAIVEVDTDASCPSASVDGKESLYGIAGTGDDGDCGGHSIPLSKLRILYFLLDENIQAR
jgi:hypothetical protein